MAGGATDVGSLYSPGVGLIYIFNLIIGTGALAMPNAFSHAGWLISLIFIILLSFISYLTCTFVIETMASANAVIRWQSLQKIKKGSINSDSVEQLNDFSDPSNERRPLLSLYEGSFLKNPKNNLIKFYDDDAKVPSTPRTDYYEISERIEMGQMAELFFHKIGMVCFYICIAIYLYGDLAIYAAAVPKSLRDLACTANNTAKNSSVCWSTTPSISRENAYRIFVTVFMLSLGPFTFFNLQKTKLLQIITSLLRWLAFSMMIILAIIRLGNGKGTGHPPVAVVSEMPNLFGVCVYAFMCHHSLPSLITPFRTKNKVYYLLLADYILILSFYSIMSFTGIFAFKKLEDLYTLNFQPSFCSNPKECGTDIPFIQYFLVLFPVFTLSTNFPIISITLRNNIQTLLCKEGKAYSWYIIRLVFPLMTLIPPAVIALATENVETLVGVTGGYAGTGIQYITPAALVYLARKNVMKCIGNGVTNQYASPFKHIAWIAFVFLWAVASVLFISINYAFPKSRPNNVTLTEPNHHLQ